MPPPKSQAAETAHLSIQPMDSANFRFSLPILPIVCYTLSKNPEEGGRRRQGAAPERGWTA
jgi:hypothetical protein